MLQGQHSSSSPSLWQPLSSNTAPPRSEPGRSGSSLPPAPSPSPSSREKAAALSAHCLRSPWAWQLWAWQLCAEPAPKDLPPPGPHPRVPIPRSPSPRSPIPPVLIPMSPRAQASDLARGLQLRVQQETPHPNPGTGRQYFLSPELTLKTQTHRHWGVARICWLHMVSDHRTCPALCNSHSRLRAPSA